MTFAIGYHQHVLSALYWLKAIVLQPNLPLASTGLLLSCSRAMAGAHMSAQEVSAMDRMHKKGEPPKDIIAKLVVEKSSALHHTRASVALCRTCHLGGSIGPTKRVAHYLFCGRSVSRVLRLNRCTPWGCRLRMVMRASGGGNFGWIHALQFLRALGEHRAWGPQRAARDPTGRV